MAEEEQKQDQVPVSSSTISDNEPTTTYPGGIKLALITIALCLTVFLVALDNTVIATAIPRIADRFQSIDDVGWYGSAYLLTVCAFQLFFGRLYAYLSIKWVYLSAIAIFEIGSAICGAAPSSTVLIIGRAIAGVGCAGILSGTFIIIAFTVVAEKRPMFNGILGGVYGVSSFAGPLLGGAFTDNVSWRWCFYINLPLGAVAAAVVLLLLKSPPRTKQQSDGLLKERIMQMDPFGMITLIGSVVCLLLALQWGGTRYPWNSGPIIALLVITGVVGLAFIAVQILGGPDATIPRHVITQRSIAGAAWFSFTSGGGFFLLIYFVPLWFQAIQGVSPVQSGLRNLAMVLASVVSSIFGGATITVTGYYTPLVILSSVFQSVGAGLLTDFHPDIPRSQWIGYQVAYGLGAGLAMQTPMVVVQTVLAPADIPGGTALMMFLQTLGGALFVSVGSSVFTNGFFDRLRRALPDVLVQSSSDLGATEIRQLVPPELLPTVLSTYNNALTHSWIIAVVLACLSMIGAAVLEWRHIKNTKAAN